MDFNSYKKRIVFLVPIFFILLSIQLIANIYSNFLMKIIYITTLFVVFIYLWLPPLISLFRYKKETPIWYSWYEHTRKEKAHKKVGRNTLILGLFFLFSGFLQISYPFALRELPLMAPILGIIFVFLGLLLFFSASFHLSKKMIYFVENKQQIVSEMLILFFVFFIVLFIVYFVVLIVEYL